MADDIRMDEVLAELSRFERSVPDGPAGFTARELAEAIGMVVSAAQHRLNDLVRSERVAFVGHRSALNIAGRRCRVPVYRLVET